MAPAFPMLAGDAVLRSFLPWTLLIAVLLVGQVERCAAQITPPAPGVELPDSYFQTLQRDPTAFSFQRAWIAKTQRAAELRASLGQDAGQWAKSAVQGSVMGSFDIPVFAVHFDNSPPPPWATLDLEQDLFGGGATTETLSGFYDEISAGKINVGGSVYGWFGLSEDDTYYSGSTNGLAPGNAKVGELIRDTLDAHDGAIDFGQFDNDGPDGLPNSGDDDGYVDFVAFVQPERGGECGSNDNIWSHRWSYSVWGASGNMPYQTNDFSAVGGTILIDDYTIQPALSCDIVDQRIEIGVFCHEFGHAFGLPDLYDINGGGQGVGHWCLMGSGNWNVPASPAHMSAWCKRELGWVSPIAVSWQGALLTIPPVVSHGVVYELSFTDDRWRRRSDCALVGSWSLAVGLTQEQSEARGWAIPQGYGNSWRETVAHDFHYDGSPGPVLLQFEYRIESEPAYDYGFVVLEIGGGDTILGAYDGIDVSSVNIDIAPFFGGVPTDYRVKFRFVSDDFYSNEDSGFYASCSPFVVDEFALVGGGEGYSSDFEDHLGGWYCPDTAQDNPPSECWLVENRQPLGYDSNVHGNGLLIYHVDQEVATSALGNSGGFANETVRGVVVEEADGRDDLLNDVNRGDAGDIWPGSSGQLEFGPSSTPSSGTNSGAGTPIRVASIELSGQDISAQLVGGDPPPVIQGVLPAAAPSGMSALSVEVAGGARIHHGASLRLVLSGQPDVMSSQNEWLDHDRLSGSFDLSGALPGNYDVVLENPDGQSAVVAQGFHVQDAATATPPAPGAPSRFELAQNYPNPFNPATVIRYTVAEEGPLQLSVYDVRGRPVRQLANGPHSPGWYDVIWDGRDEEGRPVASGLYFYRLLGQGFEARRKLLLLR